MQIRIPAVFMRGGTSKGVFFHAAHLPDDAQQRDRVLLRTLGSPDPNGRQLDGLGGGISSLSKAVLIGPPSRPDADVDYTFAQVAVDRAVVDYGSNCGNLSSAVGPFSVDEGLVAKADGEALLRIHNTNTGRLVHARFAVASGLAEVEGGLVIPGVAGTGAPICLEFLSPGGATTGSFLPGGAATGQLTDPADGRAYEVSLVDASNAVVFLAATDLGLRGTEMPGQLEADPALMARLDRLRRAAGVAMGLADQPHAVPLSNPKVAIVHAPAPYTDLAGQAVTGEDFDVGVRVLSMERVHRAVPLTSGMCVAAAVLTEGTLAHRLTGVRAVEGRRVRVGHPSGTLTVGAEVSNDGGVWQAHKTIVYRTARRLMDGHILIPASA